jgi:hypothetical protein
MRSQACGKVRTPVELSAADGRAWIPRVCSSAIKTKRQFHLMARQSLSENAWGMRLVILMDQFEEISVPMRTCGRRSLATSFYAAKVAQGQTLVILTMRADFYPKCAANAELAAAFSDHHVLVGPMSEDELRLAIERPMLLVGGELEGGLVDLLLRECQMVHKVTTAHLG